MRQKSNKMWFYVIVAAAVVAVLWVISREIPFAPQTVEQPLENTFAQ